MARPKNADSGETIDRILAAARTVLLDEEGIHLERPMRRIAEVAGVSLGTVQYYFPSRDQLLEVCLDEYYVRLEALAGRLAAEAPSGVEGREPYARGAAIALYRFARAERPTLRLRAWINARHGALPPHRAQHVRDASLDLTGALLAGALGIREVDARLAVQTMTFVVMQYALLDEDSLQRIVGRDASPSAVEAHVADVAIRLVRPAEPIGTTS